MDCLEDDMARLLRCIAVVALILVAGLPAPAAARDTGSDGAAISKRYQELFSAGDYAGALAQAKKLEPLARARFGTRSQTYAAVLTMIASCYMSLDRYSEAEQLFKQVMPTLDAQGNPVVSAALRASLGGTLQYLGRLSEAEEVLRQGLSLIDRAPPRQSAPESGDPVATKFDLLNNLGNVLQSQGRYHEAEDMLRRALAVYENRPANVSGTMAMTNLGLVLKREGRYAEAEVLYKRALSIDEQVLGPNNMEVVKSLILLAALLDDVGGHSEEAIALYRRALSILSKVPGLPDNDDNMAMALGNLATAYNNMGNYAEAEKVQLRALEMRVKHLGPNHPNVALSLANLGITYGNEGRWQEAEQANQRAVVIWEKVAGADNPDVAVPLLALGDAYQHEGKYAEAEAAFKRTLALEETAFGPGHPEIAQTLAYLTDLANERGSAAEALAYSRRAVGLLVGETAVAAGQARAGGAAQFRQNSRLFRVDAANLAAAAEKGILSEQEAGREAFEVAQSADQSSSGAAIAQMGVRFAGGSDALAAMVRENQDLLAAWSDKDKALTAALSASPGQRDDAAIGRLRKEITDIEARLKALAARLERQFPDYAALTKPAPLKVDEAQKLLGPDEALVYFLLDEKVSYVFALTSETFAWARIPYGSHWMGAQIAAFRGGLDVDVLRRGLGRIECTPAEVEKRGLSRTECTEALAAECAQAGGDGRGLSRRECQSSLFNLGLAHELYATLLGPVAPLIKDKKHLLVVPSGALTALPFHLLVTEKPAAAVPASHDFKDLAIYRDAAWLIKRQAVTVLPSVGSLKALRLLAAKREAGKPLIGFGDPVFDPNEPADGERRSVADRSVNTRAFADFWKGAGLDRQNLYRLPRLPDTADELQAVAHSLGAPASDVHLGRDASVSTAKRAKLSDYRIVYFATHGLVAGDIEGLAEPSLALSIPARPSEFDDGLLTASQVSQLRLNADWVVLSACNTIAGDKPGAEALSGLARAFFYAGARALLVSHWSVDSNAAAQRATATFHILETGPGIGRAEALRRAMLAYMSDASSPQNAYPAFWGPFSIIGEGARG
jgi:CHAT domain-containing protein/tetratricopeptide (TPR) repeat protein